jgi:hypothetical protein
MPPVGLPLAAGVAPPHAVTSIASPSKVAMRGFFTSLLFPLVETSVVGRSDRLVWPHVRQVRVV